MDWFGSHTTTLHRHTTAVTHFGTERLHMHIHLLPGPLVSPPHTHIRFTVPTYRVGPTHTTHTSPSEGKEEEVLRYTRTYTVVQLHSWLDLVLRVCLHTATLHTAALHHHTHAHTHYTQFTFLPHTGCHTTRCSGAHTFSHITLRPPIHTHVSGCLFEGGFPTPFSFEDGLER